MKTGLTELVFILDKSGSMQGLEEDTIGGFNSMLKKQKEADVECHVSTVLFDNFYKLLHDRVSIQEIREITKKDYIVGGYTALLDAVGKTIDDIGLVLKNTAEELRPEKVLFVIITDGQENASRNYSSNKVKEMIQHQKDVYKWDFLFLGANIDAVETGEMMGIQKDYSVNYLSDKMGISGVYEKLGDSIMAYSRSSKISLDSSWKEKIEEDFEKRGKKNKKK
ncbi:MAG: hypothetical protein FWG98_05375 [Candidatus Cloacimonetes bacterium]|nr:hypothetical protein [Candidatus Cloacimonadota bacterium]